MKLIIIADPDEYVRSELKTKLQKMDLEVIDLENGLEVWETLNKISPVIPDFVITEIVMPKRNGYELIRLAIQNLSLHQSKWIFYTWKDRDFDHHWAFKESLLSAYINKTDGKVSISSTMVNYLQGDDPPDGIQTLITEFHHTKHPGIKSHISRRLIDYSLPSLIRVVNKYIHPENQT